MKKAAILLMIIAIISKALGLFRDITFSYFYGTSIVSDAYFISLVIPTTIFALVGTGISKSYIPLYNEIKNKNILKAEGFTSSVINIYLVLSTLVMIVVILFTEPIIKVFASGFSGEVLNLTVEFTRISIVGVYFTGLVSILSSYLHIQNKFFITGFVGVISNTFLIISIYLSSAHSNLLILPIGVVVSLLAQFLFILPSVVKTNYKYKISAGIYNENIKKMIFLSIPIILGVSITQINVLVDRTIASQIVIGGISAITYANTLNLFMQGIFVAPIATIIYPKISVMANSSDIDGIKKVLLSSISIINLLLIPVMIGILFLSEPIVDFIFGRGNFDSFAVRLTSSALFFYAIGLVSIGHREIINRVFYSLQDTKTPVINAAFAMVLNIVLNIVLSRFLGIGGLALATSISVIVCTILLHNSLRKKIGVIPMSGIVSSFIKMTILSLVMAFICKSIFDNSKLFIGEDLSLLISILIGIIVYLVGLFFLRLKEVEEIISIFKKR